MVEFKVLLADAFAASSASFLAFFLAFFSAFLLAFSSSVSTDGVTAGVVVEDSLSFLFLKSKKYVINKYQRTTRPKL